MDFLFFTAVLIVGITYTSRQAVQLPPVTTTTKASELKLVCGHENIENPKTITATIKTDVTPVKDGAEVQSADITMNWNIVAQATGYYVLLSEDSDPLNHLDPTEWKMTSKPMYSFSDLSPNKTYYFFVRSAAKSGVVGVTYPTPGSCNYVVPAESSFHIVTKP
jgi:hypothetical protein